MDKDDCKDATETTPTKTPFNKKQQHNDEACSPFCNCTCCGQVFAPIFQINKIVIAKPLATQQLQFFNQNLSLPASYLGNIWQPPKLV